MASDDELELEYYRAVEDLFATLRGVPHVISPKDFQLLRAWWRDEVPLAAVRAGITEVFARRRERGELDPIVSLSYCRHAVRKHAQRLAEMQVGAPDDETSLPPDPRPQVEALATDLRTAAVRLRSQKPRIANIIESIATAVEAASELPPSAIEEHLFALESALLANCLEALDEPDRRSLEKRARHEAEATAATPEARDRTFRALRDRLLRSDLELPRLELDG
jgi:DNA-binding transcriptional ArsR family regulator